VSKLLNVNEYRQFAHARRQANRKQRQHRRFRAVAIPRLKTARIGLPYGLFQGPERPVSGPGTACFRVAGNAACNSLYASLFTAKPLAAALGWPAMRRMAHGLSTYIRTKAHQSRHHAPIAH